MTSPPEQKALSLFDFKIIKLLEFDFEYSINLGVISLHIEVFKAFNFEGLFKEIILEVPLTWNSTSCGSVEIGDDDAIVLNWLLIKANLLVDEDDIFNNIFFELKDNIVWLIKIEGY